MAWLTGILGGILAALAGAAAGWWWVLLAAARALPDPGPPDPGETGGDGLPGGSGRRFLVLVPAHDEEPVIVPTLRGILAAAAGLPPGAVRVAVIADNCTDGTAAAAGTVPGVEVLVRQDPVRRGKGQALAWALGRLDRPGESWDALVVLDADTRPLPGFFPALARGLAGGWTVQQAACRTRVEGEGPAGFLGELGRFAEVELFHAGRDRLGLAVFLLGTGFCLDRGVLARVPFREEGLVEDTAYTVRLVAAGIRPRLNRAARVETILPAGGRAFRVQRGRWAAGALRLLFREAPALALGGLVHADPRRIEAAFSLFAFNRSLVAACALAAPVLLLVAGAGPAGLAAGLAPLAGIAAWVVAAAWLYAGVRGGTRGLLRALPAAAMVLGGTLAALVPGARRWARTPRENAPHRGPEDPR